MIAKIRENGAERPNKKGGWPSTLREYDSSVLRRVREEEKKKNPGKRHKMPLKILAESP
jgi:hypothetical protein